MRDINVVVLVGRLTRDSELKYTASGMPVSKFSVAVNRSKKQGEEWVDEVSFFEINYWGKAAEGVNKYLVKGQQVGVEGELKQDRWEQDGQPRSKIVVNASNVRLLGNAPGQHGQASGETPEAQVARTFNNPATPEAGKPISAADTFDDDIPF